MPVFEIKCDFVRDHLLFRVNLCNMFNSGSKDIKMKTLRIKNHQFGLDLSHRKQCEPSFTKGVIKLILLNPLSEYEHYTCFYVSKISNIIKI